MALITSDCGEMRSRASNGPDHLGLWPIGQGYVGLVERLRVVGVEIGEHLSSRSAAFPFRRLSLHFCPPVPSRSAAVPCTSTFLFHLISLPFLALLLCLTDISFRCLSLHQQQLASVPRLTSCPFATAAAAAAMALGNAAATGDLAEMKRFLTAGVHPDAPSPVPLRVSIT